MNNNDNKDKNDQAKRKITEGTSHIHLHRQNKDVPINSQSTLKGKTPEAELPALLTPLDVETIDRMDKNFEDLGALAYAALFFFEEEADIECQLVYMPCMREIRNNKGHMSTIPLPTIIFLDCPSLVCLTVGFDRKFTLQVSIGREELLDADFSLISDYDYFILSEYNMGKIIYKTGGRAKSPLPGLRRDRSEIVLLTFNIDDFHPEAVLEMRDDMMEALHLEYTDDIISQLDLWDDYDDDDDFDFDDDDFEDDDFDDDDEIERPKTESRILYLFNDDDDDDSDDDFDDDDWEPLTDE